MAVNGAGRAYDRYGWIILLTSALLGLLFAVLLSIAPNSILSDPNFQVGNAPLAIRVWGITWVGFSILALILLFVPYRRGERWTWYALWLLPLLWLSHFLLAPDTPHNLVIAILTALGMILSYRRFFSGSAEQRTRVS